MHVLAQLHLHADAVRHSRVVREKTAIPFVAAGRLQARKTFGMVCTTLMWT